MSIMNIMSITLIALIMASMLALFLGVQAAHATSPAPAPQVIAAL